MNRHATIITISAYRARLGGRRVGLLGLFLMLMGGLLLGPGARPRTADATTTLFAENFDRAGLAGGLPQGWTRSSFGNNSVEGLVQPASAPNALVIRGQERRGITWVDSPRINIPNGASGLELSFRHRFNLERSSYFHGYCNDGAIVEVKYDDGPWDAADLLSGPGYHGKLDSAANPFYGRAAWCYDSGGWVTTRVRILARSAVTISWTAAFDDSTSVGDWYIDDVKLTFAQQPAITFTATTSDGNPYAQGSNSKLPVTVKAKCAGDGPTPQFTVRNGSFSQTNTTGAAITVPTFTTDGVHSVAATCSYPSRSISVERSFNVNITQVDLQATIFGPKSVSTGSQARFTPSVSNLGTRSSGAFDFDTDIPVALGAVNVPPTSAAVCSVLGPTNGIRTVRCTVATLAPNGSVYVPVDVQVQGVDSDTQSVVTRISKRYDGALDFSTANDRSELKTSITAVRPDLTVELNAFAGIQPSIDNEIEVRVHNIGMVDANRATVQVVLPAGLTYAGTIEPDACVASGQTLNCTLMATITAGWNDHIEILVRPTVPSGTALTVQATADASNAIAEANETNNGATMPFTVGGGPARS